MHILDVFLSLAETSQGAIPFLQDDECEAVKSIDAILQVFSTTSEILCGEEYPPLNLSVLFRSAVIRRYSAPSGHENWCCYTYVYHDYVLISAFSSD